MWSGPRNISTAMMRSFENRVDTKVIDEPFYAYYLNKTGLKHPLRDLVLESQSTDLNNLVKNITSSNNNNSMIFYQKHMVHHVEGISNFEWVKELKNCFLIRNPSKVINSYIKKNTLKNISEIGFKYQYELFKKFSKITNKQPIVIDSDDILTNPREALKRLCNKLNIDFSEKMLSWPEGERLSDGVWGKHWYNKVVASNCFIKKNEPHFSIPSEFKGILKDSMMYYEKLCLYKI